MARAPGPQVARQTTGRGDFRRQPAAFALQWARFKVARAGAGGPLRHRLGACRASGRQLGRAQDGARHFRRAESKLIMLIIRVGAGPKGGGGRRARASPGPTRGR